MNKLMNISKKLDGFFKVMQKLALIGILAAVLVVAVLTIAYAVNPSVVIGQDFTRVDIGAITIELAQEMAPDNAAVLRYAWVVVALGAAAAAFVYDAFGLVRKILKPMTEGRPFDGSVGRNIKKMGYISLALGVVQNVGAMLETAAAVKAFELTALPGSGAVRSITANYTFDLNFLILFFVLILMAHIFEYGAQLQQLSDETL